eukprot:TRINITY_DN633_c7_g1_i1.p1 TRINITY_DN633_c7_g1~~TRINITY_DN633_c7_g1_i1.p1  ORF type:complete len:365 (+),score=61.96 TRINITY_DN633_c7_g1_i1:69-1163(+)
MLKGIRARNLRRWCSSKPSSSETTTESEANAELSVPSSAIAAKPTREELLLKKYGKDHIVSRTNPDGTSAIIHKYNPPDNPTAHQEGDILDFSDGGNHMMKHNPFKDLARESKSGDWGGVNPHAIGIPGGKPTSLYGFERNTKYEVTNYGRENDYISSTPAELPEPIQLQYALERLPEFDATRESVFDKYAGRRYSEQRELRLIEKELLLHERNLSDFQSETQLSTARDLRRVTIQDAVMQSVNKWLPMKFNETEAAYIRQHEDYRQTQILQGYFSAITLASLIALLIFNILEDGSMDYKFIAAGGEVRVISGHTGHSDTIGSLAEMGNIHRFEEAVQRHSLAQRGLPPIKEVRLQEGTIGPVL